MVAYMYIYACHQICTRPLASMLSIDNDQRVIWVYLRNMRIESGSISKLDPSETGSPYTVGFFVICGFISSHSNNTGWAEEWHQGRQTKTVYDMYGPFLSNGQNMSENPNMISHDTEDVWLKHLIATRKAPSPPPPYRWRERLKFGQSFD